MRFIADENVASSMIGELRGAGHNVVSVKETMRGAEDDQILRRAQAENRVVITYDKDFGELAFLARLTATCGIILLRFTDDDPALAGKRLVEVLNSNIDWIGHFTVIDEERIRMRPLP